MSKIDDRARAVRTGKTPVAPDKLTLRRVERALGEPASAWSGRCFEIASRVVAAGLVRGVAVYGHWVGPVHERSVFYRRGALPFVQHGWIVLEDDQRVLDPTRWAFECVEPYLFLGQPAGLYDEGGNRWRKARRGPAPEFDQSEDRRELTTRVLPRDAWRFVEHYLGLDYLSDSGQEPGVLCTSQLAYLANAPLEDLGEHAEAVYAALGKLGLIAMVPIDNRKRVEEGAVLIRTLRWHAGQLVPAAQAGNRGSFHVLGAEYVEPRHGDADPLSAPDRAHVADQAQASDDDDRRHAHREHESVAQGDSASVVDADDLTPTSARTQPGAASCRSARR